MHHHPVQHLNHERAADGADSNHAKRLCLSQPAQREINRFLKLRTNRGRDERRVYEPRRKILEVEILAVEILEVRSIE